MENQTAETSVLTGSDLLSNLVDELHRTRTMLNRILKGESASYDECAYEELYNDIGADLDRYYEVSDSLHALVEDVTVEENKAVSVEKRSSENSTRFIHNYELDIEKITEDDYKALINGEKNEIVIPVLRNKEENDDYTVTITRNGDYVDCIIVPIVNTFKYLNGADDTYETFDYLNGTDDAYTMFGYWDDTEFFEKSFTQFKNDLIHSFEKEFDINFALEYADLDDFYTLYYDFKPLLDEKAELFAQSGNTNARQFIAENTEKADVLEILAFDECDYVRESAASNENMPQRLLLELAKDEAEEVREEAQNTLNRQKKKETQEKAQRDNER